MATYVQIASVRPWWLRLGILAAVGSPMLTPGLLHGTLHAEHVFRDLLNWTGYCLFIWLFIWLCVGLDRLLGWLSAAALFGLSVAFGGALVGKTGLWELLQRVVAAIGSFSAVPSAAQHQLDLVFRLMMTMASLPFFLLCLNSFQASDLFERTVLVIRAGSQRRARTYVQLAIMLRMVQHVFELFIYFLVAWKEENPDLLLPRVREELRGTGYLKLLPWVKDAIWVWCQALLVHSLMFVPVAVRDWRDVVGDR